METLQVSRRKMNYSVKIFFNLKQVFTPYLFPSITFIFIAVNNYKVIYYFATPNIKKVKLQEDGNSVFTMKMILFYGVLLHKMMATP